METGLRLASAAAAVARVCFLLCLCLRLRLVFVSAARDFNVRKYGAVADGSRDSRKAFLKAWEDACKWNGDASVLIPEGTFLLGEVVFTGPCKKSVAFVLNGVLKANPTSIHVDQWIGFRYVDRLSVIGRGTLDGQGGFAWSKNSCAKNPNSCPTLPISMKLDFVTNSRIGRIKSVNSKNAHLQLFGCNNVRIRNVKITAPDDSPNTDGIKIGSSENIRISRTSISTGDDCIAIVSGSRNINITDVFCGPGHGISVGSLGRYPNEKHVHGVTVKNCTFKETTNGVRIKTWASPQPSVASGFTYENIFMDNVQNPIIIDQLYCPQGNCNQQIASHVQVMDITYRNIWGTSATKEAETFQCSKSFPCKNIVLHDINLVHKGNEGAASSSCAFANGVSSGKQLPPSCL